MVWITPHFVYIVSRIKQDYINTENGIDIVLTLLQHHSQMLWQSVDLQMRCVMVEQNLHEQITHIPILPFHTPWQVCQVHLSNANTNIKVREEGQSHGTPKPLRSQAEARPRPGQGQAKARPRPGQGQAKARPGEARPGQARGRGQATCPPNLSFVSPNPANQHNLGFQRAQPSHVELIIMAAVYQKTAEVSVKSVLTTRAI